GHIIPRATLLTNLYQAHGQWHTNPQQIWIEQIQTHVHNPPVTLLTYQEWQGTPAQSRGRLSTALLSQPAPNQPILWHHVHETWLPT
ncbi:MAG TPA: hypothetical protein VLL52_03505, partial [Anaerolineae bacterium]|nr:hypothetical protein [Anaerolineae bacterium]